MVLIIHRESKLKSFIKYIDSLKNYEKSGIPKDVGTDSDDGFNLVRRVREPVSSNTLNSIFSRIKHRLDEATVPENGCLSHFEVLTALTFALFAQENIDIAIIEAGLGGAMDATNVISSSEFVVSIITTKNIWLRLGVLWKVLQWQKLESLKTVVQLGGLFLPHIDCILRERASSMSSPIISASDGGIRTTVKGINMFKGRPSQCC
ncbi:hypothetical protein V6N11_046814 [Hibiscus sabdariffa]|uniref:Uncharacterized protein n=2 Tax=Hibiscus sabdariffa TaxID=183260 RepID=A0ABR2BIB6_9ROSI